MTTMLNIGVFLGAAVLIGIGWLIGWYDRGRRDGGEWDR